jgi:hypothetical protein
MADDKPHLSRVAPIVEPDDSEIARIERTIVSMAARFAKKGALLLSGLLGGGGLVHYNQDAPVERPAPASGPNPEPAKVAMPDAVTIEACAQAREDARLAIETCAHQAEVCGAAPETTPRADPPPQRYGNTP